MYHALSHGLALYHGLDTNWIGQFDWFNWDWDWIGSHWHIGLALPHWWIGTLLQIGIGNAILHWHIGSCTISPHELGSGLVAWAQLTHNR
jgi:hypothetical protein